MSNKILDRHSLAILQELQKDSRRTTQDLSDQVGLSATPCWRRIKEMEQEGIIRRYTVLLDRQKLGLHTCMLANVTLARHNKGGVEEFEHAVLTYPEVVECYSATGDSDYILKIIVPDVRAYDTFLQTKIFKLSGVAHIRSMVVLREIKYETALPI